MSKKCPKCYTLNDNRGRYCINCGEELPYNNIPENQQKQVKSSNNKNKTIITILVIVGLIFILWIGYSYYSYDNAYHDHQQHYIIQEDENTWFSSYINETNDAFYVNDMEIQVRDSIVENPIVYLEIYDKDANLLAQGEYIPPDDIKQVPYSDNRPSSIWYGVYKEPVKLTKTNNTGKPYVIRFIAVNTYDKSNTKTVVHQFNESEKERLSFLE